MISNFHTHTYLCKHADGEPKDYVKQAEKDGCSHLGFSDHCPYPKDTMDTWSHVRMDISEAPEYIRKVREVATKASFPVHAGFECEWDKRYESWYKDVLLAELGSDYLVYGPHWIYTDGQFLFTPNIEGNKQIAKYFDTIIEAMNSGLFSCVAHPDLIMGHGRSWSDEIEAGFSAIIDASADCNIPLEVNGLGLSKKKVLSEIGWRYQYPVDKVWELVAKKGLSVICNADAHTPKDVIVNAQKARDYAGEKGLSIIESIFTSQE